MSANLNCLTGEEAATVTNRLFTNSSLRIGKKPVIQRKIYISIFCALVLGQFIYSQEAEIEEMYLVPNLEGVQVQVTKEGERWQQWLNGVGWSQLTSSHPVQLLLTLPSGASESIEANFPRRRFTFPWSGYAETSTQELRLYSPGGQPNFARVILKTRGDENYWQDIGLTEEAILDIPEQVIAVDVLASEEIVAYLVWKEDGEVRWIDRGESDTGEEEGETHLVALEGSAVALQVEIEGEGVISTERSASLRPEVSFVSHTQNGRTRMIWTATDLQSIGTSVLAIVRTEMPNVDFRVSELIASNEEGNAIQEDLRVEVFSNLPMDVGGW